MKLSFTIIIVTVAVLTGLGVLASLLVELLRPEKDNAVIIATIVSPVTVVVGALLLLLRTQPPENKDS